MAIYFLDSSALVKRYINEKGSNWLCDLFDPKLNHDFFIVILASVEVIATITRRSRGSNVSSTDIFRLCNEFKTDLQSDYQVIEITENLVNSAIALAERYGLRGYDAIQLAAGCQVNQLCAINGMPAIIFLSADNELNVAASSEGLIVADPNHYV